MRCLKHYIAREIYRVLRNPRAVPVTADLRSRRLELRITQTAVAQHFNVWPTAIARIEHDLTNRYRNWLDEQAQIAA